MQTIAVLIGAALIVAILWDAFETVVLPRRVARRLRVGSFVKYAWRMWLACVGRIQRRSRREARNRTRQKTICGSQ